MSLTIPETLQEHLNTDATTLCFCWHITKNDGTDIGFTDHDKTIVFDSITFEAATGFTSNTLSRALGNSVDNTALLGFIAAEAISDSDIRKKLYDNAAISIYRVNWVDVTERVKVFSGYLGAVTQGDYSLEVEARSLRQMLAQREGREYLATCDAVLGDTRCGVDLNSSSSYNISGSVTKIYSRGLFATMTSNILAQPSNWFTAGKLTWLTGANTAQVVEIKSHILQSEATEAWIGIWDAAPFDIEIGDTFTLQVGCAKTIDICRDKFNNVLNFRGFPRMPRTGITIKIAANDSVFADVNNGGSWYKN